jgi:hypothetical protein
MLGGLVFGSAIVLAVLAIAVFSAFAYRQHTRRDSLGFGVFLALNGCAVILLLGALLAAVVASAFMFLTPPQ